MITYIKKHISIAQRSRSHQSGACIRARDAQRSSDQQQRRYCQTTTRRPYYPQSTM